MRWVSIQHEYGIFGGDDGAYILDFLGALRVPAIVTLHTVLEQPFGVAADDRAEDGQGAPAGGDEPGGRAICWRAATTCAARASTSSPTAFPTWRPPEQETLKAGFGVAGRRMLLTFGLLGPEQGDRDRDPRVAGGHRRLSRPGLLRRGRDAPAPCVREHGEAYRTTLEREAERLGVREHVVFRDQYVTTEELLHATCRRPTSSSAPISTRRR